MTGEFTDVPLRSDDRFVAGELLDHERLDAGIADPPSVVVLDTVAQRIARTLAVPSAGPHGLAFINGLLFCASDGGELLVLDPSGSVHAFATRRAAGRGDVRPRAARVYVAIGSPGVVRSFGTKSLRLDESVETEEGAHTIGWDPARKQLWAFAPRSCGAIVYQDSA